MIEVRKTSSYIKPKVSVCMITYNHEKFISEALDSILDQQTDFDWEIVIGEDFSEDTTRDIVIAYKKKHPAKIKLVLNPENMGAVPNFVNTFKHCQGKYIAMLEGDDYWIDDNKLQKQIDILEKNPEYAICHTNLYWEYINDKNRKVLNYKEPIKDTATLHDLLYGNYTNTPTVVLRNVLNGKLPDYFTHLQAGDWALFILHAQFGKIKYLNEPTAVYRVHDNSLWNAPGQIWYRYNSIDQICLTFKKTLEADYRSVINYRIAGNNIKRFKSSIKRYNFYYALKSFRILLYLLFVGGIRDYIKWSNRPNPWRI